MPSDTRRLRSSPRRRELDANSSKRRRPSSRLISRTAQVLSEDSRLDRMSDSDLSDVDENDPKSMARWAKKMGQQMGGDELGEDFDQVVGEMEEAGPDSATNMDDDDL